MRMQVGTVALIQARLDFKLLARFRSISKVLFWDVDRGPVATWACGCVFLSNRTTRVSEGGVETGSDEPSTGKRHTDDTASQFYSQSKLYGQSQYQVGQRSTTPTAANVVYNSNKRQSEELGMIFPQSKLVIEESNGVDLNLNKTTNNVPPKLINDIGFIATSEIAAAVILCSAPLLSVQSSRFLIRASRVNCKKG